MIEIKVEKDETKKNNWHLILHLGFSSFIPLYGEFSTEEQAQDQADVYNKDLERTLKGWCAGEVRDAVNTKWLQSALKGKI